MSKKTPKYFDRFCKRCQELYTPTSKYQTICSNCLIEIRKEVTERRRINYEKNIRNS